MLHKMIYNNSLRNIKQTLRIINIDNLKRLFKKRFNKENLYNILFFIYLCTLHLRDMLFYSCSTTTHSKTSSFDRFKKDYGRLNQNFKNLGLFLFKPSSFHVPFF